MSDSQGKEKLLERFISWVNGDREPEDRTLFVMENAPRRHARPAEEQKQQQERQRLHKFLFWYPTAAGLICIVLVGILLSVVLTMPVFGHPDNPTNNEVPEYYLEHTEEDTGAVNAVTGMILTYRGFDTLGESCVLFMAVTSVMILLLEDEKNLDRRELKKQAREEAMKQKHRDIILEQATKVLIPFIFLFAAYVLFYGENSPGGGFSGGTVLGSGLVLFASAFGFEKLHRFFSRKTYDRLRIFGLVAYAVIYGYYTFMGANGQTDPLSALGGLSMPIDIAVGMVVACTVYGFYALFARGDL